MVRGALQLVKAVRVTYGPQGRTVMLDRQAGILSTRDGVAVALEVCPQDPIERLGASVLQDACLKVGRDAGDGTSTTALIAGKLLESGHKYLTAGYDPQEFVQCVRGILEHYMERKDQWLTTIHVTQREMLEDIALHTTKSDREVAKALADACLQVGKHGMVVVEDGKGLGVEVLPKHGMELNQGWETSDFTEGEAWAKDVCLVAVVATTLTKFEEIVPILEASSMVPGNLPLLIVSHGIYGDALKTMVTNTKQNVLHSCGIRAPGKITPKMRVYLEDIAALTQARVFDPEAGMSIKNFESRWLGSAQQVSVQQDKTTLVCFDDAYENIENRVKVLREEKGRTTSNHDLEKLQERIAKLTDGFCVLRVGGVTPAVAKERKGRIEDGLHAVRAALNEGVCLGAGTTAWRLAQAIEGWTVPAGDETLRAAQQALCEALRAPVVALVTNAGYEAPLVLQELESLSVKKHKMFGFDVLQGEMRNLRNDPMLLDPIPVVLSAIETAVSVSTTLLTCDISITKAP